MRVSGASNRSSFEIERRSDGTGFGDFFAFRTLITPWLIKVLFVIGLISQLAFAAYMIVYSNEKIGAFILFFGWIPLRIVCEIAILNFTIHTELVALNNKTPYRTS